MPDEEKVESTNNPTKFMLAIARQVYDSPVELTLGMSKAIVVNLLTQRRDDMTDADVHSCIDDIASLMHECVELGLAVKRKLDHAAKAPEN